MTGPFTIGRELWARIPVTPFSRVSISGVEVTQAIQFQGADRDLTDAADISPDNSITLVADKPSMVRVFVRSRFLDVPDVTGRVTIQRIKWGSWHDVEAITPEWPGSISAGPTPDYAATRLSMRRSLNFRVPGGRMRGLLRLRSRSGRDQAL